MYFPSPERPDLGGSRGRDNARAAVEDLRDILPTLGEAGDTDTAERFLTDLALFTGAYLRHADGRFYVYRPNRGVWTADSGAITHGLVQEWATATARRLSWWADLMADINRLHPDIDGDGDYQPTRDAMSRLANARTHWTRRILSYDGQRAMLGILATRPGVFVEDGTRAFDADPYLIAARNGVVDLRSGELHPHAPKWMVTRRVEHDYRPDAEAPGFLAYLRGCFDVDGFGEEYVRAVLRLMGYSITGDVSEHIMALHYGPRGRNGKSVLLNLHRRVFDPFTKVSSFDEFVDHKGGRHSTGIADLEGSRVIQVSEGNSRQWMNEALLKRLSGADPITARRMRADEKTFAPTGKLHIASNELPRFGGQGEALWDRILLIEWPRYFAPHERDLGLEDRLFATEAEGIFALMIREAAAWHNQRHMGGTHAQSGLIRPPRAQQSVAEYREESSPLAGFLPGWYEVTDGRAPAVRGEILYRHFEAFAKEAGLEGRIDRTTFYRKVQIIAGPAKRTKASRYTWTNLAPAVDLAAAVADAIADAA